MMQVHEPYQALASEREFLALTGHEKLANCCNGCACASDLTKDQQMRLAAIEAIDLKMVKMKLCLPIDEDGKGWSVEMAEDCEVWYKRFLYLVAIYPGSNVVPTKAIDEMWHSHILDTRKYMDDCQKCFGEYLHHFPYLGLRGNKDKVTLQKTFDSSCALFMEHFGSSPKSAMKPGEVNFAKSSYCSSGSACGDTAEPTKASSCAGGGSGGGGGCSRNDISVVE